MGELHDYQIRPHLSKFDVALGCHIREYEQLRTDTFLEDIENTGIFIVKEDNQYSRRYYQKEVMALNVPKKVDMVADTLRDYLLDSGFTVSRKNEPLHVRHLERMRHRTGYILGGKND